MGGHHNAPASSATDQVGGKCRTRLHVDELGSAGNGLLQDSPPGLLVPVEAPPLPDWTAGHEHGAAASLERRGRVGPVDTVQADLDEVSPFGPVTVSSKFVHRAAGDGHAHL